MAKLKQNIKQYNILLEHWKDMFGGEEHPHQNMGNRVLNLTENYKRWRILANEPLFWTDEHPNLASSNHWLGYLLNDGNLYQQLSNINILSYQDEDGNCNDFSLRKVVRELRANREIITREVFVTFDGTGYNPDEEKKRITTYLYNELEKKVDEVYSSVKVPTKTSQNRHETFEKICGINWKDGKNEGRNDLINKDFIDLLDAELDKCNKANLYYQNVMLNPKITKSKQKFSVTLEEIEEIHVSLWKVFNTLYSFFLDTGMSCVLTYGYGNPFIKDLENPWIPKEKIKELEELENKINEEYREKFSGTVL